jgi:hypothetical protein
VESTTIKKTIEAVYAPILPNNTHPFVYLSLEMPPEHLDVNVHPTKREVRRHPPFPMVVDTADRMHWHHRVPPILQVQFLYEDMLLERLVMAFQERLEGANTSRTFYGRSLTASKPSLVRHCPVAFESSALSFSSSSSSCSALMPLATPVDPKPAAAGQGSSSSAGSGSGEGGAAGMEEPVAQSQAAPPKPPPQYAHKKVRTDALMGSMRAYLFSPEEMEERRAEKAARPPPTKDGSAAAVGREEGMAEGGAHPLTLHKGPFARPRPLLTNERCSVGGVASQSHRLRRTRGRTRAGRVRPSRVGSGPPRASASASGGGCPASPRRRASTTASGR